MVRKLFSTDCQVTSNSGFSTNGWRCSLITSLAMPLAVLLVGLAPSPARAEGPSPTSKLTSEQRVKIFPEQKVLTVKNQKARIAILQQGERCVSAAATSNALKNCMRQERQQNMAQRRSEWSELRSLYARYGIKLPESRPNSDVKPIKASPGPTTKTQTP